MTPPTSPAGAPSGAALPNLPLRLDGTHDFRPAAPGLVLASDITQFRPPDDDRRVYLSAVLDLWDGKPLGWSAGTSPDAALADASLGRALSSLPPGSRPVAHADRLSPPPAGVEGAVRAPRRRALDVAQGPQLPTARPARASSAG